TPHRPVSTHSRSKTFGGHHGRLYNTDTRSEYVSGKPDSVLFGERSLALLRRMIGPDATFRPGQREAIEALTDERGRLLVVQSTGWGKSAVYFIATKIRREQGHGPTLLI